MHAVIVQHSQHSTMPKRERFMKIYLSSNIVHSISKSYASQALVLGLFETLMDFLLAIFLDGCCKGFPFLATLLIPGCTDSGVRSGSESGVS